MSNNPFYTNVLRVKCVGRYLMPPQSVEPSKDNTVTICAILKAKIAKWFEDWMNFGNFHSDFECSCSARKPSSKVMSALKTWFDNPVWWPRQDLFKKNLDSLVKYQNLFSKLAEFDWWFFWYNWQIRIYQFSLFVL